MRKIVSLLLSLSMIASLSVMAFATDITTDGGSQSVPVELSQEVTMFSVTVPTVLPIDVDNKGEVTVATNNKIINNSYGPVEVKNVAVESQNDWVLQDFTTDFKAKKVGLKEYGLQINNSNVSIDGSCSAEFDVINGGAEINFTYDANVAAQSSALEDVQIANVVFTMGWSAVEVVEKETFTLTLLHMMYDPYNPSPDQPTYTFTVEEGMTWVDLVSSPYNDGTLEIYEGIEAMVEVRYVTVDGRQVVDAGGPFNPDDLIISSKDYRYQ